MAFNIYGVSQKQSAQDDPFAQAIIDLRQEQLPSIDELRTMLDGIEARFGDARGVEREIFVLSPIVNELDGFIAGLDQYVVNDDIQAIKRRATNLRRDVIDRCYELTRLAIETLAPDTPMSLYFEAYGEITGSTAFSEAQRTYLVELLENRLEMFGSQTLGQEAAEETPEDEGPPPDTYSASIDSDHKAELENNEQVAQIRNSWNDLYTHGIWRQLAVQQIQRALDNGGSEDAINDATQIIDDSLAADQQAIARANEAAANLPPNLLEESGYMLPRLEDIMTTVLDEIGVEPPLMFTADPVPFERQQLQRAIGDAAVEGYASYLREKLASIRSTGDSLLSSMVGEIVERAPEFTAEFEIFADQGHVTGIVATPTDVQIAQEGAYFPSEEIAERMIQSIGDNVRMPCYMHFIRITLKFVIDRNEVTATIVE